MAQQPPPWRLPDEWAAERERLGDQIDVALRELDPSRRTVLLEAAAHSACNLLGNLMAQPPFQAAMNNIGNQSPVEIAGAIQQLRAGDWGTVVHDIDEMLRTAGFPGMHARRAAIDGVTGVLTADPAMLVGSDAVAVFDRFRGEVCGAEASLGQLTHAQSRHAAAGAILDGVDAFAVAIVAAAAMTLGGPVVPAVIAVAAAVVAVRRAHAVFRIVRNLP